MPEKKFQARILELDAAPVVTPNQTELLVKDVLGKALAEAEGTQIQIKAGELPDADHQSHASYFIGICYPAHSDSPEELGGEIVDWLREECGQIRLDSMRLPVVEIFESHAGYRRLVGGFGWGNKLASETAAPR